MHVLGICLPFHLSFCGKVLLELVYWFLLKLNILLGAYVVCVCDKAEFFEEKYFAPEMGKMDQKWTKSRGFLIYCKIL